METSFILFYLSLAVFFGFKFELAVWKDLANPLKTLPFMNQASYLCAWDSTHHRHREKTEQS